MVFFYAAEQNTGDKDYGPALIAADHVSVVVLEVADTSRNTVVADGRVKCARRRRRHHHFLEPGRRACQRRRGAGVIERQADKPRRPGAQPGRRRRGR